MKAGKDFKGVGTKYGTLCFQLLTSKVAGSLSETCQRDCSPLCLMDKTTFLENQQMDTSWGLFINITILFYVKRCQNSCQNGFVKKLIIFVQILNEGFDLQYINISTYLYPIHQFYQHIFTQFICGHCTVFW